MDLQNKFNLIVRNLGEIVGEDKIKDILKKRNLKVYWGTAPTGKPHIAYFLPIVKIADLLKSDCEVIILFANIHAYLDNMKSSWDILDYRTQYYEIIIKEMLKSIGVNIKKLKFVMGSDFQLKKEYTLDVYKLSAISNLNDCTRAGAEVVKQVKSPKLSGLLYPILQSLDEIYLGVDAQFGGIDQRKIFMYAREFLPKIKHSSQIHLMNPMIAGLTGNKMSSSDNNSKIDILDSPDLIKKKFNKANCVEGDKNNNAILDLTKYIIFPLLDYKLTSFKIERPEKFGGNLEFNCYEDLECSFVSKELHPSDLKQAVSNFFIELTNPIRDCFNNSKNKLILKKAYE
ncbi:tyrosine--tRNA ligase [Candidatus Woesearchaeota archaeon]|jgi:tyrosyl-tRNA synthetase|nr:tyrosine--tRNA ligase [Candidatus Woesearchaeota archaeon]MBT4387990.1 tyrosine--tRNA ligase [Candidatus Woesearchaeota archaeon]MBT4595334.1 tyrosine--tRNA ligase [Candidatus Woesearchaeota archaeon]MBT5741261.1 tyrosine--tRNA ligase [Candidatus Woesearchaeota archaeon]MBT6505843.1 tyrosine--tRNA ligase [Candidatus Woesearchaeota archaeon]